MTTIEGIHLMTQQTSACPAMTTAVDSPEASAVNAPYRLVCQHVCRWRKTYTMPCHILKAMPDGRLKVLVFGDRYWKGREHVQRVRYVEASRVVAAM